MIRITRNGSRLGLLAADGITPAALCPALAEVFASWRETDGILRLGGKDGDEAELLPLTAKNVAGQLELYGFLLEEEQA